MFGDLTFSANDSAQLDRLLSDYLHTHRIALHRTACPPWRNRGRQPGVPDGVSFMSMADAHEVFQAWSSPTFGHNPCE
jgi:hypothetical protein